MMDKVDKALASSETIDAPQPEAPAEAQVLADSEDVDPETPPAKASPATAMVESDKRPKCHWSKFEVWELKFGWEDDFCYRIVS